MALLYRYYPLTLENTLAHFWLLLLQLFLFLCLFLLLKIVFFFILVANILPIINLPTTLGNLPIAANGLPLVPISNDIWASHGGGGGGGGGFLNRQNPLSMTKVICWHSFSISRHHNFWNPHKILIQVVVASKNLLWIFGISPT